MGLFKKDISGESVIVQAFQNIAQAIDVAAQTGADKKANIEIGDIWALYFWIIKPFEKKPERLNPDLYDLLKYTPGSPFAFANNTKTYQSPSQVFFTIHPDDYELYVKASMEIKDLLETRYLDIATITNDGAWMQECGTLMDRVIKKHLPTLHNDSTEGIIFILALALRSILKDTKGINSKTVERLRKFGILHISMMVTSWHFKSKIEQ
jgi:hypothetical protein